MKTSGLLLLLALTAATAAQESATQTPANPPHTGSVASAKGDDPSALVKASQAAKKKRGSTKKAPRKVIRNSDLKSAKSTLLQSTPPQLETTPADAALDAGRMTTAKGEAQYRARKAAEERVTKAEKSVVELQAELSRVEQAFYDENDPNYRDSVIQKHFTQTKRQLNDARRELADARDALAAADPKS